ncbi:type I polyketide synthase [Pseudactinotalea sp. HY158]|uniref:type I polyketide synthase n=1 Tax=Pseudactinotalea sp. HY158 TaxID=2654547 RepID=UPI0018925B47|nr:type I polyketide synthase [Pseudactinotalea sp. HY158]
MPSEWAEAVAIVGIGCRFPGGVHDTDSYWDLLRRGRDGIVDIPADRWSARKFYDPDLGPGHSRVQRGGFLEQNVSEWDAQFFGISPREADFVDPQHRFLMEVAYEAIEDSGTPVDTLAGSRTGVFVGGFTLDYSQLQFSGATGSRGLLRAHTATGVVMTMFSNRISHAFDLTGPSMTVDTACSSSLVAVHLACQSLLTGESTMAIAGGVNLMLAPNFTIAASQGGFLSPTSRSRPFHAEADGYVRAEGCGVVLLEPLSVAIGSGRRIYAIIRGSAVNQDGRTNGITVPNGTSQKKAMKHALAVSGIDRDAVGYVEAHGTGTPVGDPIEANAIGDVYGRGRDPRSACMIASVKSNIGHTEAAAGVAGLIKAALVLRHREVPAHLHLTELNPKIDLEDLRLRIPTKSCALPVSDGVGFAAVNSFGFGGTNAHLILQEAPDPAQVDGDAERSPASRGITPILPLAARSNGALSALATQDARMLTSGAAADQIAAARVHHRALHPQSRAAVLVGDLESTRAALDALSQGSPHADLVTGGAAGSTLVWLFTGMGPQWWGMARDLLERNPIFAAQVERVDAALTPLAGWSIVDELRRDEDSSLMGRTQISQCANFTVQLGLAAVWRELGVPMDAVIGHSAGEVAAAYVTGALSFDDAVTVVFHRARLQQSTSGQGRLLAASISPQEAQGLAPVVDGRLHLAAINGPESIALVGDVDILVSVQEDLEKRDVFARMVPGDVPFHGPGMDPLEEELREVLADVVPSAPTCPMYSTVTGESVTGPVHDADYWWRNVRQPVQFAHAARCAIRDGHRAYLELGPNPVLGYSVQSCLTEAGVDGVTVSSLRRKDPDAQAMAVACARLFVNGLGPDWRAFYTTPGSLRLPLYPWHRDRYWMESEATRADRTGDMPHPLLGRRQDTATAAWSRELDGSRPAYLSDHMVHGANLFPGAGYVDMALRAGQEEAPAARLSIFDVTFHNPVVMQGTLSGELETVMDRTTSMVQINGRATSDRPWTQHMTGFLAPARGAARHFDIAAARDRCPSLQKRAECYSTFAGGGFDYGPQFQMIEALWLGDGEAVARFDSQLLGGEARAERGESILDPILLDGCFQLLLPLAQAQSVDLTQAIPVGVGRIEMLPALDDHVPTATVWTRARISEVGPDLVAGDVVVTDDAGNVLLQVDRFQVRLVDPDAQVPRQGHHWLYEVDWEAAESQGSEHLAGALSATSSAPVEDEGTVTTDPQPEPGPLRRARHWLMLNPGTGAGERLAHMLTARGDRVLMATTDSRGKALAPGSWVADLNHRSDLEAVLAWAAAELVGETPGVIDLRALGAPEASLDRSPSLAHQYAGGLLDLVQAMDARDLAWPLTLVTAGAQPVTGPVHPAGVGQAAVWGMGRVLHQESVELAPRLVDLDPDDLQNCLPALVDELHGDTGEDQLGLRSEGRFVARLQPSTEPDTWLPARLAPFGTYLITGGLGALGVVCARWLARRGARRVVLTSRKGLPPRDQWDRVTDTRQREQINTVLGIEQEGTTVEVVALDTTDAEQVREFVTQRRRAALPPLHGVLHAAGVLHDTVMVRMSPDDLHTVLNPKVEGTLALHHGLEGEPLDFFALFSSVSSVVVTSGQANYAAANAYMDAFASRLRAAGVAAVSINWGPWDVGMIAEMNLQAFYGRRGIDLIPERVGVQLLSVILGKSTAQQVIVSADWPTLIASYPVVPRMIEHLGQAGADDQDNGEGVDWKSAIAGAEPDQRLPVVTDGVANVLGAVLRIGPDELNRDVPLNQLGLDSMIAVEVRIRIERALGYSPKVVTLLQGVTVSDVAALIDSELAPAGDETPDGISEMVQNVDPDVLEALLSEIEQIGPNGTAS